MELVAGCALAPPPRKASIVFMGYPVMACHEGAMLGTLLYW